MTKKRKKAVRSYKTKVKHKELPKWTIKLLILLAGLASIGLFFSTSQFIKSLTEAATETKHSLKNNQMTLDFIGDIGGAARQIAHKNDLYASVMIAQAILESSSGQSTLSKAPSHNLFGIKGDYNGNSVTMKTWEDDGSGNSYTIDAQFRSYANQAESLQDYADFLQKGIYQGVHKSNTITYQDATAALTGTYATDTSYGDKLNSLIKDYDLTIYDAW